MSCMKLYQLAADLLTAFSHCTTPAYLWRGGRLKSTMAAARIIKRRMSFPGPEAGRRISIKAEQAGEWWAEPRNPAAVKSIERRGDLRGRYRPWGGGKGEISRPRPDQCDEAMARAKRRGVAMAGRQPWCLNMRGRRMYYEGQFEYPLRSRRYSMLPLQYLRQRPANHNASKPMNAPGSGK